MAEWKVFYHIGNTMGLRSKVYQGVLRLTDDSIEIEPESDDDPEVRVGFREITFPSETFRLHAACRMVRITHRTGCLFFTVALIGAFGVPVVSNSPALIDLQDQIDQRIRTSWLDQESVSSA